MSWEREWRCQQPVCCRTTGLQAVSFGSAIRLKVCLAPMCLLPTHLSVMCALYCRTTQHFRTCVAMPFPLTFTNYTHTHTGSYVGGSNTDGPGLDVRGNTQRCRRCVFPTEARTHIHEHRHCCVMRHEKCHASAPPHLPSPLHRHKNACQLQRQKHKTKKKTKTEQQQQQAKQ